jgi:hypothetical protein
MKNKIVGIFICMLLICVSTVAVADWDEGEPFKMHFPQLPDPNGFDVDWGHGALGDDWQCIETGNVDDIHFWISWFYDDPMDIPFIDISIWSNNPQGPGGWSEPLELLWQRTFQQGEFVMRHYGDGAQLWMMPWGEIIPQSHIGIYQINIIDIVDPFEQIEGEIYWLVIGMPWATEMTIGWKTSIDWFMDHPVWLEPTGIWVMIDGIEFAFVITGEPPAPPVPDLDCRGDITWAYPGGSQPGGTKTGTFEVGNVGEPGSLLNWQVTGWPTWGNWTFTPPIGWGLPDGSWTTVTASVIPPNAPNQVFTGFITVTNIDNSTDTCQIPVTLETPRVRQINLLLVKLLERLFELFPILNLMLN